MNRWLRKIDDKATSSVSPFTRWLVGWYAGPPHLKGKAHYFEDGTSLCGAFLYTDDFGACAKINGESYNVHVVVFLDPYC